MKKFFICLLIVLTICLGCFALTACDNDTEEVSRVEFVKNEYHFDDVNNKSFNYYLFRVWYPMSWFTQNEIIDFSYKFISDDDYIYIGHDQIGAEYIFDGIYKPDSWIYFIINIENETKELYFQVASFDKGSDIPKQILFTTCLNLANTYKSA